MPSMNWDDFIESSGEEETPPPANTYLAVVETAEWTSTKKAPPRPMLKVRLRIEAGPEKGKALFTQVLVDPDAQPFAKRRSLEQLNALGLSASDLKNKNLSDGEQCDRVVGTVVEVETSIDDKYDPQNPRARVDKITAAQGAPSTGSKPSASAPPKKEKKAKAKDTSASTPPPAAPFDDD